MPVQRGDSQQQGCCLLRCGCRRLLAISRLQHSMQAGHAPQITVGAVTTRRFALPTRQLARSPAGHITGLVSGSQAAAIWGHSCSAAAAGDQMMCLHSQAVAVQQHQLLPRSCSDSTPVIRCCRAAHSTPWGKAGRASISLAHPTGNQDMCDDGAAECNDVLLL